MRNLCTLALLLAGAALVACNTGKGSVDDDDDDGGGGVGGDGTDFPDETSPVITEGYIWCAPGSDSSGFLFFVEVQADDPQGVSNLAEFGSIVRGYTLEESLVFEDEGMVCEDGECVWSFRDGIYPPITCATADDYKFTAQLKDEDGNIGPELDLEWLDDEP